MNTFNVKVQAPVSATRTPAYSVIRDQLRADIFSGKLPAGTRLTIASLVEHFGISQMPVREALQALEGEGLITMSPHRGACVLSLDMDRVRNIYDLRGAIEVLMVRLSVPNLTNAAMAELNAMHNELQLLVANGDQSAVFSLNLKFHGLMYKHSGNPEAFAIYDRYASLLGMLRARYGYSRDWMPRMLREHDQLLEALRAQDETRLETTMRFHVEGARDDLLSRMAGSS